MYMLVCWCDEKSLALLWGYLKIYTHHYVVHRLQPPMNYVPPSSSPWGKDSVAYMIL